MEKGGEKVVREIGVRVVIVKMLEEIWGKDDNTEREIGRTERRRVIS